jgi:hypothetical protein
MHRWELLLRLFASECRAAIWRPQQLSVIGEAAFANFREYQPWIQVFSAIVYWD